MILSLEASTSSAKAMLFDRGRGVLAVDSIAYAQEVCDGVTFSPEGVAGTVLRCGAALLARFPGVKIDAVGLSSIWHSLVLLDADKCPVEPGLTWADVSAGPTVARYRADADLARAVYQATGCPVHGNFNLWKWMHARETRDVSAVRHVSCLPEYLSYALTGELAISKSVAAGSSMLSARTLGWDDGMLRLAGITRDMLGRLVEPHASFPMCAEAARALGLPAGTPVAAAGPDGALNHIAAGGLGSRTMSLSVGTSGAIRLAHTAPIIPRLQSTWSYYCAEGLHLVGAATSGAGNCVNWFVRDLLGSSMSFSSLEDAAAKAEAAAAPYFMPFIFGERSPGWDEYKLGGFRGIAPDAGVGAMYRAVLEGILFNLYQNYTILIDTIGAAPEMISVSGGITQSPFWMALAADTFDAPLVENTGEHASLLGAAYMAERAVGLISSLRDIPVDEGNRHMPDLARREAVIRRFGRWLDYYNR